MCVEPFIGPGRFMKFNNNCGYVGDDERNTPQAFSHFSFEASNRSYLICDLQGVDDYCRRAISISISISVIITIFTAISITEFLQIPTRKYTVVAPITAMEISGPLEYSCSSEHMHAMQYVRAIQCFQSHPHLPLHPYPHLHPHPHLHPVPIFGFLEGKYLGLPDAGQRKAKFEGSTRPNSPKSSGTNAQLPCREFAVPMTCALPREFRKYSSHCPKSGELRRHGQRHGENASLSSTHPYKIYCEAGSQTKCVIL